MHTFFYKLKFYNSLILLDFSKSADRVGMYEQLLLSVVPRGTLDHFQPVRGQKKMPGSGGKPIFSNDWVFGGLSEPYMFTLLGYHFP